MGDKQGTGTEDNKRIDLSVPQVAGSALAAVTAAVLASTLGVYGTFIGAGVVSVVATCGGTVFQHFFRRTGEQLREVTVQAKVGSRHVPVVSPYKKAVQDETTVLPRADADRTQLLKSVDETQLPRSGARPAREFNDATVHGTRLRGWKRPLLAAAVVFGVSMGGITAYELVSGSEVGGHGSGTTLQSVLTGGGEKRTPPDNAPSDAEDGRKPSPGSGGSSSPGAGDGATPGGDSAKPDPSSSPSPSKSHDAGSGSTSGSGSGSGGTTPTPTPSQPTGSATNGSATGTGSSGGPGTPESRSGSTPTP
ncbi:hypothetical protein [Streptomyces sp. NBC_01431]|uniref:hypothetical protein n=1 Tax=Streptomyces sp. NBC_01431 TaxID=2903863 RepID=UPI002E32B13C|nr:hypothetical protein [Streptomyces sp. NBC_01431]